MCVVLWNVCTVSCKSCVSYCVVDSQAAALDVIDPQNRFCVLRNRHSGSPAIIRCTSYGLRPGHRWHVSYCDMSFWQRCHASLFVHVQVHAVSRHVHPVLLLAATSETSWIKELRQTLLQRGHGLQILIAVVRKQGVALKTTV